MMKQLAVLIGLVCTLGGLPATAQTVTGQVKLAWDPNPANQNVTKYTVYRAPTATGPWTKEQEVAPSSTPTATVTGLAPGTYFFAVTASNLWIESSRSNVVAIPPPSTAPSSVSATLTVTVTVP